MAKTKLETTKDDHRAIAVLLDAKVRSDAAMVKVPRDILWRIFRDHGAMVTACRDLLEGDL